MKKNIGTADRLVRLAIAVVLFIYAWWAWSWLALLFGLFTLYEAIASWCVLYQLIGKNTCPINHKK